MLLSHTTGHWDGLTLFLDRPEIPLDNNATERHLREL
ncbi:IS66 family transposase [Leptospirillum ferriphilum]